ncbi:MAG TPA: CoA-disulfide reductase [Firmicutes bacterium]|nr:CoA-disulfide reductase [Bacillota bacterium]
MSRKYVIVGGVAGGASFAARLRRLDEEAQIIMVERGAYISFANCGLPYYVGDVIKSQEKLVLQQPEEVKEKFNIDIRILHEVTDIKPDKKSVSIKNLQTGEVLEESYDELILSPGAKPFVPPINGLSNATNLFTVRTIPDAVHIKQYIKEKSCKKATVIGAGFIGIEMAENLHEAGLEVTIIERADQVLTPIDIDMARYVHETIEAHGVKLLLNTEVTEIRDFGSEVVTKDGRVIESDIIIFAIGVVPETSLVEPIQATLGVRGTIKVNDRFETSIPNIYAIGDAIEVTDFVTQTQTFVPLAWPANRQGRLLADMLNGSDATYKGTVGTAIAKVFDLTVASTGANEKTLNRLNREYEVIHTHPYSHAGYYPGAMMMHLKLIFDSKTGDILGAQGIGAEGVDKRIDVISTAMQLNAKAPQLAELELCYAPPFSSAKDPVNHLGYIAGNIMDGKVKVVKATAAVQELEKGALLLDIRENLEVELDPIPNSLHIPLTELRSRLDEIPIDKKVITACAVGLRGYVATRILMQKGFNVYNLDGGLKSYPRHYEVLAEDTEYDATPSMTQTESEVFTVSETIKTLTLDACGLQCPGPIMKVNEKMRELNQGDVLEVRASDPGFKKDIEKWCQRMNHTFISADLNKGVVEARIAKGLNGGVASANVAPSTVKEGTTMVVFSGDMDKVMASFIIANGAAAMGKDVTMFFTFWGLNVLRKTKAPKVKKDVIEAMFGAMMPQGASKLQLSKMNMGGMGAIMMKKVMKDKNVNTLDELIESALKSGVKIIACTMSMDVMGIKKDELIDGIDFGGVASYLAETDDAGLNLFI